MSRQMDLSRPANSPPPVNDTQVEEAAAVAVADDDDDDVIFIPQHIETIDLCTSDVELPRPLLNRPQQNSTIMQLSPNNRPRAAAARANSLPYRLLTTSTAATSAPVAAQPNLSQDVTQPVIIHCPICLESIVGRHPVSTFCGHLYCEACIRAVKECPMCRRRLPAKKPFHDIFI